MSKVTASTDIQQVKPDEVARFTDLAFQDIVSTLNGNLDFQTNFNCKILSVTFSAANTQVAISHGLGRIPAGYLQISSSVAASVYNGDSSSSSSVLYLKSSAPATVGLIVF